MKPERWKQVEKLFDAALEREATERAAFLNEACEGDEDLNREVTSLLASAERAERFLSVPARELVDASVVAEPASSPVGRQIAHYQVLAPLGAGGMGEVYLAHDMHLRRKIALKLLPARLTADADRLRRFEQEARTASALNHPNIITIFEIGQEGATHYIAMEFIDGETLRQQMDRGWTDMGPALDVAVQMVAAVSAAHEAGITHRDIKPENVMVRRDGYVKVLDFGLAKLTEPVPAVTGSRAMLTRTSTEVGVLMGTPRYMSPEQLRGEKTDVRTDIFSLGVLLYEMIARHSPFEGVTTNEIIAAILRDAPHPLTVHAPAAPKDLELIIVQTLRKERADRYQTAGELLADLKQLKERMKLQAKSGPGFESEEGSYVSQDVPAAGVIAKLTRKLFQLSAPALRAIAGWVQWSHRPLLTEKNVILLADFANRTGEAVFDGTLKQALAIQLRESPFLSLFSEDRVRQTLRLMKRSPGERITPQIAREICLRHNIKALIAGSIVSLGAHYVITLEAIHGQTGEALQNEQVEARSKEQVLQAVSQAAARLRAKLGESVSSIHKFHLDLEETTTQKLDAFQAYSLGYDQSLSGRFIDAIQLYRRAVELDPDFAYAWSMLSIHHSILGLPGLAAEYAEKAYGVKDQVSEYEQLQITFRYHFNFTGNLTKAIEAAILFKRMYPQTSTAPIDLVAVHDLVGRHDQAVEEGREALRLNPDYAPAYWYLGRSLLRVGHFAEAKDIFQQALDQKFSLPNIHAALYQIGCVEGDTAGMQQQLEWAKGSPEEYVPLSWQAGIAAFSGQWGKAQELLCLAIDLLNRGATKELGARHAAEQALWGAVLGDSQRGALYANHGLLERGRASLPRAALALALCGEANQAEALMNELKQRYPEDTVIHSIWLPTIRAALLLDDSSATSDTGAAPALNHLVTTITYESAAEFWPQTLRGRAYLKLERGAEAALEFQKIVDHRGQSPLSPLYPLAHLGLARAAAMTGNVAKAQQAYEAFLTLWKDADGDLPPLTQAKRELESLRKNSGARQSATSVNRTQI